MAPFPPLELNKPTEEINYSSKHISAAKRDITSLFLGLVTFKQMKYVIKKETLVPEVYTTQSVGHHL